MADESASLPSQPLANSSGSAAHNSTQLSSWAEEMELRDPLLDDDKPAKGAAPIKVVPVTDRTNQLLTEAFTSKMTGAERRTLRASYTLPQNDLTRAPFLDAMMASECSKTVRSTDRSLYTLQGLILEAVGPLSQLLEAVNDPNSDVTMDQIGDAVETAITLIANASNKTSLMRRTRVLEEYNKELVTFASAGERDWTSAAPRLFGPNFLKEAADYLQHLQLIRKVKQPSQGFRQPPSRGQQGGGGGGGGGGGQRISAMETTSVPPPDQPEELPCGEEGSPKEEMTRANTLYEHCIDAKFNYCIKSYVGQGKGYGVHSTSTGRDACKVGRQINPLYQRLEGVDNGQLGIANHQGFSNPLCREACTGKEAKSALLPIRAISSGAGRSLLPVGERGSDGSRQSPPTGRILFCPVPGPQKEWRDEASNQPQSPQSMGRDPSLQDGGLIHSPRSAEAGRLASKGGLEGCIPNGTGMPRTPMLPTIHHRRSDLSVHLPSLRSFMCPVGFHQDDEGSGDLAQVMGDQDNHLYRRHLNNVRVCNISSTALGGVNTHPKVPGVHNQHQEISDDTDPGNRVPRDGGELQLFAGQASRRQAEADPDRGWQNFKHDLSASQIALPLLGETQRNYPSCPLSPTILPLLAERSSSSSSSQQPGLRDFPVPLTGSTERVVLVEGTPT